MFKNISSIKGFTLVEVLVSLAIFTMTISIGILAITSMDAANKRIRVKDQSVQSAYFMVDSLSRQIRMGKAYTCLDANGNDIGATACTSSLARGFGFTDQDGVPVKIMFRQLSGQNYGVMYRRLNNNSAQEVKLHDEFALKIRSAGFLVGGTAAGDTSQPFVSFRAQVIYSYRGEEFTIPIQTTLTQRELDQQI